MLRIAVLTVPQSIAVTTAGVLDLLGMASGLHAQRTGKPAYTLTVVAASEAVSLGGGGVSVHSGDSFNSRIMYDVVLVPGLLYADLHVTVAKNPEAVSWLKQQIEGGAQVGSMCVGAYLVAATGHLDGKRTTLHWAYADAFRQRYPNVQVTVDPLVVDNGNLFSGGGASSYLNLLLYFVDRTLGRELMLELAQLLLIDPDRVSQSQYSIFTSYYGHGDTIVRNAQSALEQHYHHPLAVEALAEAASMSPRNFLRRFKAATGITPSEYLQKVRVEAARQALLSTDQRVNEIQLAAGYEDEKTFRNLFKRHTGLSPVEYRNKFKVNALRY